MVPGGARTRAPLGHIAGRGQGTRVGSGARTPPGPWEGKMWVQFGGRTLNILMVKGQEGPSRE